jgi:hypothetical protein
MHAVGTRKPSAEDLDAIEKLLDRFERDGKNDGKREKKGG